MEGMEISGMKYVPFVDSKYIVPGRVSFKQNGYERKWDYVKVHDSVAVLIYNKTRDAFVLVKQFRPAAFLNINSKKLREEVSEITGDDSEKTLKVVTPFEKGVTYELCAGIVDQKRSLVEIAQSEIEEETGYVVPLENIKRIYHYSAVGHSGNQGTVYYTEVTDDMKSAVGGGNRHQGEFIEVFYLPRDQAKEYVFNDDYVKNSSAVAAFLWYFMENKM